MSFISGLFGKPKKPKNEPIIPATDTQAPQDAAATAQQRAASLQGRASTILTGGGLGTVGK